MFYPSYGLFVGLGFLLAFLVKRAEDQRLGYGRSRGYRVVTVGALVGAVIGSKLGMLLYLPWHEWVEMMSSTLALRVGGKTILGAIAGGYLGVELAKKVAGVRHSTGDAYALALPVGQAFGRLGCFFTGCCAGSPLGSTGPGPLGLTHHPVQLYEAFGLLVLTAVLFVLRKRTLVAGQLFRGFLVGFALLRFVVDFYRGDARLFISGRPGEGLSYVQVFCALAAIGFAALALRTGREARRGGHVVGGHA